MIVDTARVQCFAWHGAVIISMCMLRHDTGVRPYVFIQGPCVSSDMLPFALVVEIFDNLFWVWVLLPKALRQGTSS